jgi:hypothetical protein
MPEWACAGISARGARHGKNAQTQNIHTKMDKYIIELTEDELKRITYMLDKGWDYLLDKDYFYGADVYTLQECWDAKMRINHAKKA